MIYILENADKLGNEFLEKSESLLSVQRTEKLKEYAVLGDKINSCAVYLLLRYGLKTEYGISEKPVFEFRQRGKPYLKDHDNIFFNLSHCKNAAACILSEKNTAIDIMEIRKVHSGTLRRTCTQDEKSAILSSSQPERDFIKLWTRKECFSKLDGRGLLMDFSKISEDLPEMKYIHSLDLGEYIISYYSEKPAEISYVSIQNLLEI